MNLEPNVSNVVAGIALFVALLSLVVPGPLLLIAVILLAIAVLLD